MEEKKDDKFLSEENALSEERDQKSEAHINQENVEHSNDNLQLVTEEVINEEIERLNEELRQQEAQHNHPEEDHEQEEMNLELDEGEQPNQQGQQANNQFFGQGGLFELVDSIRITNLLSEDSIDSLRNLLCPPAPLFDGINLKDPKIDDLILNSIIKEKSLSAQNTLGEALNYYHKMLVDSQIHHLDKLIRIIKSKRREMHLHSLKNKESKSLFLGENIEPSHGSQMSEDPMDIIGLLEGDQLGTMILKKRVLPVYNPSDRSIRFNVNDKYEVKLKICDDILVTQKSKIDKIPSHIMQTYIFPFLTSSELFSMRAVSNEWRDLVRGTWHTIFKREMLGQIVAAELCNDIEMHFKLMQIRTPFYQKFGSFLQAIVEMIDWNILETFLVDDEKLCKSGRMVILTLLKMLGDDISLQKLWEYQESDWEQAKKIPASELRERMLHVLDRTFVFDSNDELLRFKKNFIDSPDISASQLNLLEDKTFLMIALFLRQMFVFGLLRNHLSISQKYVLIAKERLKDVSRGWSPKRGFLEGAYKILLFRYVKIVNGQIIVSREDEDEETMMIDELDTKAQKAVGKTQMRVISNRAAAVTQTDGSTETESQTSLPHLLEKNIETQSEVKDEIPKQKEEKPIQLQAEIQDVLTQDEEQSTIKTVKDEAENSENIEASLDTIEQPRDKIIAAIEEFGKELSQRHSNEEFLQPEEQKIEQTDTAVNQVGEEKLQAEISGTKTEDKGPSKYKISPAYISALSSLLEGFDEIKEFYSEDLETSLDRLVKSFVAKSKEKQNQANPEPDYVIFKNGTETRVFLDDETRLEMLIQKFLKFHILMLSLRSHIQEKHSTLETVE